jgi:hypothetical protein
MKSISLTCLLSIFPLILVADYELEPYPLPYSFDDVGRPCPVDADHAVMARATTAEEKSMFNDAPIIIESSAYMEVG